LQRVKGKDTFTNNKYITTMKREERKIYSAPEVEIIEVAVEKGFAVS